VKTEREKICARKGSKKKELGTRQYTKAGKKNQGDENNTIDLKVLGRGNIKRGKKVC